ncbi:MAG: sigma-E processing peptidase SpoIIGA [Candidatus Limivicinus sp.]|nr:sigma-E processing peptidase SpoIIGA [Candidatus Limivicinus sp.]
MQVIYVDSLFFLNLCIDYLLCLVSARVCGLVLKRLRYLLSALIGACYSVAVFLPGLDFLASPLCKLAAALLMGLAAFGGETKMLRCCAVFLSVSAAFGGAVWAISMAGGGVYDHRAYLPVNMRVLVLSFALCYGGISLLFRRRAKLMDQRRVQVRLVFLGRESQFMALLDTGNSLSDPVSGKAVMVAGLHALRPVLGQAAEIFSSASPVDALELLSRLPEYAGKFRLIPYSAVGVAGMLPVFTPELLTIDGKEEKELLVAVSPTAVGDGFEAVI